MSKPRTSQGNPASVDELVTRADALLARLEQWLPVPAAPVDWDASIALRWRRKAAAQGVLEPILQVHRIDLRDLHGIDEQKQRVERNTCQFVDGHPANNVLLTGARGTGKSSLIKALLNKYAPRGLRLIEVEKRDLTDLPDIVELIHARKERYILYCDDLSFEADEPGYKALKVVLDGSVAAASENCLIYATSNRRHLMPEFMSENLEYQHVGEEIHPGETSEEKVSLSERFGLWVSFYPFDQDEYLEIVHVWLAHFKVPGSKSAEVEHAALQWALARGSRSGRVAWQFARDWAGRTRLARRK
ncbi:MAG: ATP-binding protein [Betaproteobacteria bacterium]|jgi:predicted AAA+ superfamily ATPase|nr:ATP-binding protein [Betaproteobacteria bacterium]MDH4292994.1 ATP-binding protein [Betaproteobacteria bacterium]MDH5342071.1 ATP-binding protein [Betaproteobacteria bacterium]